MIGASKNRRKSKVPFSLVVVSIIALVVMINHLYGAQSPMDEENPETINVEIPSGSNSKEIAIILKENGLIRDKSIFRLDAKIKGYANSFKSGYYSLSTGMSIKEIMTELTKGGKNTNVSTFTVPEGYELRLIAEKLSEEGFINENRFLELTSDKRNFEDKFSFLSELDEGQSLEGYLFPSTYEIFVGASEEEIIEKMLVEFEKIYEDKLEDSINNLNLSLDQAVTLGSIIEREARRDDERELVSAVFHNRLNIDMPLQSCATVQYILGERKEVLTNADTQIQSEFNTYINNGLPPSPIASPGKDSLIASINPADVDYLYFRTKEDGTGAHVFSRTYEEHLDANPNN